MTDQEKRSAKLAMVRVAQADVRDAVDSEQAARGGSYMAAWARAKAANPAVFDELSRQADDLEKIEYGQNEGDPFYKSQGIEEPTTRSNVPDVPGSKPSGSYPPDPRISRTWPQRPKPVKDPRVQGVASSKEPMLIQGGFATRLVD
jgi:hypothetical protein